MNWEEHYEMAKAYYQEHGNLKVSHETKLYTWLSAQKYAKKGKRGQITREQIALLEKIGIDWENDRNRKWMWYYQHAQDYYSIHGTLNVPVSYVAQDGCNLGQWLGRQRRAYRLKNNTSQDIKHRPLITQKEINMLENIGMKWDVSRLGYRNSIPEISVFYYIKKYFPDAIKLSFGDFLHVEIDIYIPSLKFGIEYDGYKWHRKRKEADERKGEISARYNVNLVRIREKGLPFIKNCKKNYFVKAGDLEDLQIVIKEILYALNIKQVSCDIKKDYLNIISEYKNYSDHRWDYVYEILKDRYINKGYVDIKAGEITSDGVNLYSWLSRQREEYKKGKMTKEHIDKFLKLGISLNPNEDSWNIWINSFKLYYEQNGDCNIPIDYVDANGMELGKWLSHQRENYRRGILDNVKIQQIEKFGVVWNPMIQAEQEKRMLLVKYYDEYGNINMPKYTEYGGVHIWEWLQGKKKKYIKNELSKEEIKFFEKHGIVWDVFDERWQRGFDAAKKYYEKYGNLSISVKYVTDNNYKLGEWISAQRGKYKNNKLTEQQIHKLNFIGMCWNSYDKKWFESFEYVKKYYKEYGNINIPCGFVYKGKKLGMWLSTQRQAYRGNPNYHITEERIALLNNLGMCWKIL